MVNFVRYETKKIKKMKTLYLHVLSAFDTLEEAILAKEIHGGEIMTIVVKQPKMKKKRSSNKLPINTRRKK